MEGERGRGGRGERKGKRRGGRGRERGEEKERAE